MKYGALEEFTIHGIGRKLAQLSDIRANVVEEGGDGRDDTGPVGTQPSCVRD